MADIYINNKNIKVPTIKEMKEIIISSIDLDKFLTYQNGNLVKAKKGAPRNAVMTPIGSSAGAIATLAIISVKTKKVPPKKNENGIINL